MKQSQQLFKVVSRGKCTDRATVFTINNMLGRLYQQVTTKLIAQDVHHNIVHAHQNPWKSSTFLLVQSVRNTFGTL